MRTLNALICALSMAWLASCGGGGGASEPAPPPPAAAAIRFEVVYEPAATPPNVPAPGRYLTVRALPGSTALGTRTTAKVELQLAQEAPRSLAAPSYVDAQGRPNYVFAVSADYPSIFQFRSCASFIPFEVTVADETGYAFTKYGQLCPGQAQSVGAFSDYGDRVASFRMAGPAGATQASFHRSGAQGYTDSGSSTPAGGNASWSVKAAEGDRLFAMAQLTSAAAPGAVATADIETDRGAYARSVVARNTATGAVYADASLLCCRADVTIATVTPTRTITFVVAPAQLGSIPGGTIPSVPFTVHYRVADGATQRTIQEFSGAGTGYSVWTHQVKPGDQLTLEASAPGADTMMTINVLAGAASGPAPSVELGMAKSFLPGAAAKLNVFCCAQ